MMNTTKEKQIIRGGKMKKIYTLLVVLGLTVFLCACNFSLFEKSINAQTLNHISTVVMNANIKVSTSTYRREFFQKIPGPYKAFGSGVIFKEEMINNTKYYYVLTNEHVVNLSDNYDHEYVIEDIYSNVVSAELVTMNKSYDLAILRFKAIDDLYVVELAKKNPKVNETVFSLGSPSGKHNIITVGKILGYITTDKVDYEIIVHDAIIYKGSSGGMLINDNYQLIGINTWGFTIDDKEIEGDYVKGGATPIEKIKEFLSQEL